MRITLATAFLFLIAMFAVAPALLQTISPDRLVEGI